MKNTWVIERKNSAGESEFMDQSGYWTQRTSSRFLTDYNTARHLAMMRGAKAVKVATS